MRLNVIELFYPQDGFTRDGQFGAVIQREELTPHVRHTGHLFDAPRAAGIVIACIGIRMGKALIGCQMWSGKFGQRAKVYPTRTNGYEDDKATELFRQL